MNYFSFQPLNVCNDCLSLMFDHWYIDIRHAVSRRTKVRLQLHQSRRYNFVYYLSFNVKVLGHWVLKFIIAWRNLWFCIYSRHIKLCKTYEEKVNNRAKNLVPKKKSLEESYKLIVHLIYFEMLYKCTNYISITVASYYTKQSW